MSLLSLAGKLKFAAEKLKCFIATATCGGGRCCGGQWYPPDAEGDCCDNVWHVGTGGCPEGQVYLRWGEQNECCGCVPETLFDPRVQAMVNTVDIVNDLCCGCSPTGVSVAEALLPFDGDGNYVGCYKRCCVDGECTDTRETQCAGQSLNGCCDQLGCPVDCCSEDAAGVVQCSTVDSALQCLPPKVQATPDCATGCLGQCCIDGDPQGEMTQEDCAAIEGNWQGLGTHECGECPCREPFTCDCCESKTSTAAGLTFTQPFAKRQPPFDGTFRVTVTGKTESTVLVHGTPVAAGCDFTVEFSLCWGHFNIEPVPCGTNFKKLDVTVCWFEVPESESTGEELNFSGCDGLTIHLGNCEYGCETVLVYNQNYPRVSDAHIYTHADSELRVVDEEIEFTGSITPLTGASPCANSPRVLTLSGGTGRISGVIGEFPSGGSVEVRVQGFNSTPGEWWLSGANQFSGRLKVLDGTLVIGANVNASGYSPFGSATSGAMLPIVGSMDSGGIAALLLDDGVTVNRGLEVASSGGGGQLVVIGGRGSGSSLFSTSASITLNRSVTLQAASGGTVTFANSWSTVSTSPTVTIGSAGNTGTVVFDTFPATAAAMNVAIGTAMVTFDDVIDPAIPVTVGSSLGAATLDLDTYSQTLDSLAFAGSGGLVSGGTLRLTDAVAASGTGHEISSDVAIDAPVTLTLSSAATLELSGEVSGADGITVDGSGTLTLSAANTYSGGTVINGGTVSIGDDDALGTGGVTVNSGATLNLNGHTVANTITNSGGTVNP